MKNSKMLKKLLNMSLLAGIVLFSGATQDTSAVLRGKIINAEAHEQLPNIKDVKTFIIHEIQGTLTDVQSYITKMNDQKFAYFYDKDEGVIVSPSSIDDQESTFNMFVYKINDNDSHALPPVTTNTQNDLNEKLSTSFENLSFSNERIVDIKKKFNLD